MQQGFFSRIGTALTRPSDSMTWTQLAGAVVFVVCVMMLWRQVTLFVMQEI